MARYVLLEFDDTDTAEGYARLVGGGTLGDKCKVVGLYFRPTIFCDCESSDRRDGYTRGRKYGIWVHAKCGKPTKAFKYTPVDIIDRCIGYNLLHHKWEPPKPRDDTGQSDNPTESGSSVPVGQEGTPATGEPEPGSEGSRSVGIEFKVPPRGQIVQTASYSYPIIDGGNLSDDFSQQ